MGSFRKLFKNMNTARGGVRRQAYFSTSPPTPHHLFLPQVTDDEVDEMIRMVDKDGDGQVKKAAQRSVAPDRSGFASLNHWPLAVYLLRRSYSDNHAWRQLLDNRHGG